MTQDRRINDKLPTEPLVFTDANLIAAAQEHLRVESAAACLLNIPDTVPALVVAVGTRAALRGLLSDDGADTEPLAGQDWNAPATPSPANVDLSEATIRDIADRNDLLSIQDNGRVSIETLKSFAEDVIDAARAGGLLVSAAAAQEPSAWTKERITDLARDIAVAVAKNANTAPQLTFPDIYLGLTEALAAPVAAQAAIAPEGFAIVPLEPTPAMMDAAEAISNDWPRTTWKAAWAAMLAAAPAAPLAAKGEPEQWRKAIELAIARLERVESTDGQRLDAADGLRALLAAPLAGKVPEDERAKFGVWITTHPAAPFAGAFSDLMWDAWQARASLTAPLAEAVPAEEAMPQNIEQARAVLRKYWVDGNWNEESAESDGEIQAALTLLASPAEPAPIQTSALTDEQLRETDGYKLGWMEGMQEGAELATGGEKTAADVEAEFADLLPGSYYMDPPDGGSPSVLEQVRRMAEDAARWREHSHHQFMSSDDDQATAQPHTEGQSDAGS